MKHAVAKRVIALTLVVTTALQNPATIALAEQGDPATVDSDASVLVDAPADVTTNDTDVPAAPQATQPEYVEYVPLQQNQDGQNVEVVEEDAKAMAGYEVQVVEPDSTTQSVHTNQLQVAEEDVAVEVQDADTPAKDCDFVTSCEYELSKWPAGVVLTEFNSKYWVGPTPYHCYKTVVDGVEKTHWGYSTWCSEFVGWNLWNVGLIPGKTMPRVPDRMQAYLDFYKAHPELGEIHYNDGTYTPRNGDIILCFGGVGHTEMISRMEPGGKSWIGVSGGTQLGRTHGNVSNRSYNAFVTVNWGKSGAAYAVDTRVPLANVNMSALGDFAYTGRAIKPKPTITYGYYTLREGTDYTLSYANNVNGGTATVTIRGAGEFYGTRTLSFNIIQPARQDPVVSYHTHVQRIGWQNYVSNGAVAGTSGKSRRLEAIQIRLDRQPVSGDIQYRTHIQRKGWEKNWKSNDGKSGTSGKSLRLEAIQIRLTGKMAEQYDVYYRVHAQKFGWMGWAKNGAQAGTAGYSYRLEAIQIVLVPKGQSKPTATYGGVKQRVSAPFKKR